MVLKLRSTILCIFLCLSLAAQETVRSTVGVNGSSTTLPTQDGTYVVQQSVGQASVIGQHATENITGLQGFIQPPISIKGVVSEDNTLQAVVYPNPFNSSVTIRFSEELKGPVSVVLYDISGRVVYQKQKQPSKEMQLDFSGLASASYLLYITQAEKEFTANLIKN
ncbi:MAG TPA: hypothetical protein DEA82_02220 [Flavobacteriaceae bacterium]|nr:hypothetical protein [Flavobacteriaceae bacterium]HBR53044.1 hypothetical protein [Flavobacteriaceae bacterium]